MHIPPGSFSEPPVEHHGSSDVEDMSTCDWHALDCWLEEQETRKKFCRDFHLVCKKPRQENLFQVESGKRIEVVLEDYLPALFGKEVIYSLVEALEKSTCVHTGILRNALAQQYAKQALADMRELNERTTLG